MSGTGCEQQKAFDGMPVEQVHARRLANKQAGRQVSHQSRTLRACIRARTRAYPHPHTHTPTHTHTHSHTCACLCMQAGLRDSINEARNAAGQAVVLQQHQVCTHTDVPCARRIEHVTLHVCVRVRKCVCVCVGGCVGGCACTSVHAHMAARVPV